MKLNKIAFIFLFLNFSVAQADFSGLWIGEGLLYLRGKKPSTCTAFLQFRQSSVELETIQGQFDCQSLVIKSLPKIVVVSEGRLYYKNQLVGAIGDQDIFSSYWDFKAGWTHQFRLHRENNAIHYFEQTTLVDGYEFYRIEAVLKLVPLGGSSDAFDKTTTKCLN